MDPFKVLVIFGTRPEAIKLAPVVKALRRSSLLHTTLCVTSQHREMLESALEVFDLSPDINLDIMQPGQDLLSLSARLLDGMGNVLGRDRPGLVLVHGDTTTAFMGALSAFYMKIPVGHVEAGLRTHNRRAPFPEEINRQFIDATADLLFAPTETAVDALRSEHIDPATIHLTGNTIVDAVTAIMASGMVPQHTAAGPDLAPGTFILVTGHRRENFGHGFESICAALREIALARPDLRIVYPVHLNPNVHEPVHRMLGNIANITLTGPLDYVNFLNLMSRCLFLISDSGGVQEEACVLKKPVLLMREVTERPEAVSAGFVKLVGVDQDRIVGEAGKLLNNSAAYQAMVSGTNPYGDGNAAARIVSVIEEFARSHLHQS